MQKITNSSELRSIQIGILNEVKHFCRINDISYYLCAGTLIGAIRHQGYIPWDDDIDICMPRSDYQRFFQTFNIGRNDEFIAIDINNSPDYYCPFGKVINKKTVLKENVVSDFEIGINIDVFPLDRIPNDSKTIHNYCKSLVFYKRLLAIKLFRNHKNRAWEKRIVLSLGKLVTSPLTVHYLVNRIEQLAMKYDNNPTLPLLIDIDMIRYGKGLVYHQEDFNQAIQWQFENGYYSVPVGYDRILKSVYGDYMSLPPTEQQEAHHSFNAYWK